jgi:SAM-dependent methyltransferase
VLLHPLARGLDLDAPETTELRRALLRGKPFLHAVYREWYGAIAAVLPRGSRPVLEVGAGAGFSGEYISGLIRSDVLPLRSVDVVLDACRLPFASATLRAVVMTNVLHHLQDVALFFQESARCVVPGGALVMVEPWYTGWSRFIYRWFHHEPCDPAAGWELARGGPLLRANSALPWIVFERDRPRFERECARWRLERIDIDMPLAYCLSGGLSRRAMVPGWSYSFWRTLERAVQSAVPCGMFARIVLRRKDAGAGGA